MRWCRRVAEVTDSWDQTDKNPYGLEQGGSLTPKEGGPGWVSNSVHAGDRGEVQAECTIIPPPSPLPSVLPSFLAIFKQTMEKWFQLPQRLSLLTPAECPLTTPASLPRTPLGFLPLFLLPPNSYHFSGMFSVKMCNWVSNLGSFPS